MKKSKLLTALLYLYCLIRHIISPIINMWYEIFNWRKLKKINVNLNYGLTPESFYNAYLNKKYKSDPLAGLIDFSIENWKSFFINTRTSRDCDSWSRMWYWYGLKNADEIYEVIMTPWNITKSHMITIMRIKDQWWLCNYKPYKVESYEDALFFVYQNQYNAEPEKWAWVNFCKHKA